MDVSIWWIRRDLRLRDNYALQEAISTSDIVIPLFILDPKLIESSRSSQRRLDFLYQSLAELDKDLQARGSRLIVRKGNPVDALTDLVNESKAKHIFAEADYSPYARNRDEMVAKRLPLKLTGGLSVGHPEALVNQNGKPYKVFTPFMRNWKAKYIVQADQILSSPERIETPAGIKSESLPALPEATPHLIFEPGEKAAFAKLDSFLKSPETGISKYADQRNMLDTDGTAGISPYLRFGMLSIRQCVYAAQQVITGGLDDQSKASAETWLNELIWREFYIAILYHFPEVMKVSFREEMRAIPWRNEGNEFLAWCEGRTGFPVVDAGMRQLSSTGWMHNRNRMIVASFLVKDLAIDWRWGEKYFMQQLIDGDPAANNGGWQWVAGTGTDAAPYFRVFNPVLQGKKFDPSGDYVRRWLPELKDVPEQFIHSPWKMPMEIQEQSNCIIGEQYPYPIIDHKIARERILEIYKKA